MPETNPKLTAEQQAAHWRAQLSSDRVTAQHRREFAAWLVASAEHKAAWDKVDAFWQTLDQLPLTEHDFVEIPKLKTVNATKPKKRVSIRYYRPVLALTASVLLAIGVLANNIDYYFSDYHTETGQQRQITLADGSQILMNTQTAISVDYAAQRRTIHLHKGEAYFKVAPDTKRPFVVETDNGQAQALGTAFDVKESESETAVTVFEHAVKITTANGKTLDKLVAGQRAVFNEDLPIILEKIDTARAESWQKRRMVFQNRTLVEVVAELERYRPGRIVILGSAIKNLRLTGVFGTENTDIALHTIEQSLPVKINTFTDRLVVLSAK
jgi:transmembrane sensor